MSIRRVIAYPMHEHEWNSASRHITQTQTTDSFMIGDVEEDVLADMRNEGIIVDELPVAGNPTTAAMARQAMSRSTAVDGWSPTEESVPVQPSSTGAKWMVSLDGPLDESRRSAIEATGVQLEEYIPYFSYVASGTSEQATDAINLAFVKDIVQYGSNVTGAIRLTKAAPPDDGRRGVVPEVVKVWDLWLSDESVRPSVLEWLREHGIEIVGSGGRKVRFSTTGDSPQEGQISFLPGVLNMIEHVPPKLFNDMARSILGISSGNPGPSFKYQGRGQIIGVADTGLDDRHPDFQGRIVGLVALGRPGNSTDTNGHGTHVAGSVLGDGAASGGAYRGVAPEAELYFQSLLDAQGGLGGLPVSLEDLFEPAYLAGARVHNNSWGAATASAYTVDSTDVDNYSAKRRDMLVVFAAGNEGTAADNFNASPGFVDWMSLGSPATSKNALTVGAARSGRTEGGLSQRTYSSCWPKDYPAPPIGTEMVSGDTESMAAFSSRGPCDDRRIKPDLVAPGTDILSARSSLAPAANFWGEHGNQKYAYMGGTSMACPLVSGCAALVREYYVTEHTIQPSAALVKATLINGTRWLSGADATADHDHAPNYHQGFGEVSLTTTLPGLGSASMQLAYVDSWKTPALQLAETGRMVRFTVKVLPGMPLRLCLAYTDLPGRALQNDLSLIAEDTNGRKYLGNEDLPGRISRSDVDNNVEVIRIDEPVGGEWNIQVFARNLLRGPQDFALVVTGSFEGALRRSI